MTARLRLSAACGAATLLACAPLAPLFDSLSWLGYAVLAVGTVTATSVLARRTAIPGVLVPLVNLAVLVLLVSTVFGAGTQLFGVLPSTGTPGALQTQISAAFTDIVQLAVPVPPRRGLLLLTVLGVGAVAVLVDALAVTLRRAPLAGLPMLAMFAVPVAVVRTGLGWFPFALAAAGYLFLLLSEGRDRISRWGRPFADSFDGQTWRPDPLAGSPMAGVGRRIGAAAIGFAVVVPALVPFVHEGGLAAFAGSGSSGSGYGPGSAPAINPIAQLRGQLNRTQPVELLRVKTSDTSPFYLRVTTLDDFRRSGWQQGTMSGGTATRVKSGLPRPDIASNVPTRAINSQIDVRGLVDSQYLPVYAEPSKVDVKGDWRYDRRSGTVFTTRTNTRDLSYKFTSVTPDQSSTRLQDLLKQSPEADQEMQVRYGSGNVPESQEISRRVTDIIGAKETPYERTLALYDYFRDPKNGFTYSTATKPGNSGSDLIDFLDNKEGYCEQYASAMAAMARYAGLPARVAIGYTKGVQKRGYWSVTTNDAHAWVEVYFQGVGWVPWDPTPLSDGGRATTLNYASPSAPVPGASPGAPSPGPSASLTPEQLRRQENLGLRGVGPDVDGGGATPATPPRDYTLWWVALALCLVLLVVPSVARLGLRQMRLRRVAAADPRAAAHAAWDEVMGLALDLRLRLNRAETPRVTASILAREGGLDTAAAADLGALAGAEERARYSRSPQSDTTLAGNVRQVRRALLATASRRSRLRARLLPASVISSASRQGGLGTANLFNSIDAGLARLRRAVRSRVAPSRSG